MGGGHLEGDWAALDLPLRIPQERAVLGDKAKKETEKRPVLTKDVAVALTWMQLKGLVTFRGGQNILFNRTHPLCTAAHRLFPSVVTSRLSGCDSPHT